MRVLRCVLLIGDRGSVVFYSVIWFMLLLVVVPLVYGLLSWVLRHMTLTVVWVVVLYVVYRGMGVVW